MTPGARQFHKALILLVVALVVIAAVIALSACARWGRDPLAAWRVDPDALGLPETTVFVVPF